MNNLLEMLTKAGYEVSSIGSDVLPCTLRVSDEPIGFLMEDLSVRLLPEKEKERARLEPVISFAAENQGLERIQEESVLSRYQNTVFTASFDYDGFRPVYGVYSEDKDHNLILLSSFDDKAAAAKDFITRSGLASGDIPSPARSVDRVRQFMDTLKEKGFQFRESREDARRAFDIVDQDGHEVGYIGKDDKVTITSENSRIKHTLTEAYLNTNPNSILLPGFFERLKERLKEVGMALKVIFTPKGRHYAIHNGQHQEVATVSEKEHTVTYTDVATDAEKARIDALVEELRNEFREKEPALETQAAEVVQEAPVPNIPSVSAEEIARQMESILSDSSMAEALLQAVRAHPEFIARLNERATEPGRAPAEEKQERREMSADAKIRRDFDRYYNYLQTVSGFSPEKQEAARAEMTARFGTADPEEFKFMLEQGTYGKSDSLKSRLNTSQRVAEVENIRSRPENKQTKERA